MCTHVCSEDKQKKKKKEKFPDVVKCLVEDKITPVENHWSSHSWLLFLSWLLIYSCLFHHHVFALFPLLGMSSSSYSLAHQSSAQTLTPGSLLG